MKYKPYKKANFKYEMGLQSLDLKDWIDIDEKWEEETQLKSKLLNNQREKVLQTLASADAAVCAVPMVGLRALLESLLAQ